MSKSSKTLLLSLLILSVSGIMFAQKGNLPEMVFVKGGSFQMGNKTGEKDEQPVHSVSLSDFYIGKYEVTVEQYRVFCKETGKAFPEDPPKSWYQEFDEADKWTWKNNNPITNVTWNDAVDYCKWLSKKTGDNYNLPTEAQWEYAAKGGQAKAKKFSGSENANEVAWYDETTYEKGPRPVGSLKPNELGIYDMSGNAWEWCLDKYGNYTTGSQKNPQGPSKGNFRVVRGGGWYYVEDMCRVTARDGPYPYYTNYNYGFRVVKNP